MLNEKYFPNYFWVEAVTTIVYIMNWTPVWGILAHLPHEDMHSQNSLGGGTTM
jgi:hypothetical protein